MLKDSKGRQLTTVMAAPLSDASEKAIKVAAARHQDELLAVIGGSGRGASLGAGKAPGVAGEQREAQPRPCLPNRRHAEEGQTGEGRPKGRAELTEAGRSELKNKGAA